MQEKLEKKVVQVLEKIWHVLCGKKILFGQEVLTDEKKILDYHISKHLHRYFLTVCICTVAERNGLK